MATVRRVDDRAGAVALAELLNGTSRTRPVVVVTIPAAREEPWIDVEEIAREAGDLADVYLMPTSTISWDFSTRMAEGTQVYGGAGRVYPVGHEWAADLSRSPLRFAFDAREGKRATDHLISDAWRMAVGAGLTQRPRAPHVEQLSGVVQAVVGGRALVGVGRVLPAAIAPELTLDGVPAERLFTIGQPVEGLYDRDVNRLDVTGSLRSSQEALAAYSVGDVVLAKVVEVQQREAVLLVYPKTSTPAVTVTVPLAGVTANPLDDLRSLMTEGEVVAARITTAAPRWQLVLDDVDDDEPVLPAPSLLAGGPPWLVDEPEAMPDDVPDVPLPSLPAPVVSPGEPAVDALVDAVAPPSSPVAPPRPTPRVMDRQRTFREPQPAPAVPIAAVPAKAPTGAVRDLALKVEELQAKLKQLERTQAELRAQLQAGAVEYEQLRYLHAEEQRRANRAENDLKNIKARLRKATGKSASSSAVGGPQFADAEQGFRYLVLTRWATRTLPSEQHERPLPDYDIGPQFLASVDRLEGIKREKVADVVFEIVTELAAASTSREVHRLRTGPGGEDPVRTRPDGAVAWRASLQVNTPSARRIHYWQLPDGRVELARVATHDDFSI